MNTNMASLPSFQQKMANPFQHLCPFDFPSPNQAEPDGFLAHGGDLSVSTLLCAYAQGVFPWYNQPPILWWSPDPRMVLFPAKLKVSSSLRQKISQNRFTIKLDSAFSQVIYQCARMKRKGVQGTWLNQEMEKAYNALHQAGYAHSVEVFQQDELVGGLYGIALGRVFFGESMFHLITDASKVALYYLVMWLNMNDFSVIDVQQSTAHLKSMGAMEITRKEFLQLLEENIELGPGPGKWLSAF